MYIFPQQKEFDHHCGRGIGQSEWALAIKNKAKGGRCSANTSWNSKHGVQCKPRLKARAPVISPGVRVEVKGEQQVRDHDQRSKT